jgi:hypothetical protein
MLVASEEKWLTSSMMFLLQRKDLLKHMQKEEQYCARNILSRLQILTGMGQEKEAH